MVYSGREVRNRTDEGGNIMANSHSKIFQTPLEGNKYDPSPEDGVMQTTTAKDEKDRQSWLANYKTAVYEKIKNFLYTLLFLK